MAEKFLNLVLTYPVVFVSVQHRNQDVKVYEQILESTSLCDLNRVIRTLTPLGELLIERVVFGADFIAERFEQSSHKLFTATAGNDCDSRSERQWNSYEFGAIFAVPCHCGIENPSDSDTHERRSYIGAVIDVLVQHPTLTRWASPVADEPYRINVQQKRDRTSKGGGFRVENVCFSER